MGELLDVPDGESVASVLDRLPDDQVTRALADRVETFVAQARALLTMNPNVTFTLVALPPNVEAAQLHEYLQLCAMNVGTPIMSIPLKLSPELHAKLNHIGKSRELAQGAANAALEGLAHYLRRTPSNGLIVPRHVISGLKGREN